MVRILHRLLGAECDRSRSARAAQHRPDRDDGKDGPRRAKQGGTKAMVLDERRFLTGGEQIGALARSGVAHGVAAI